MREIQAFTQSFDLTSNGTVRDCGRGRYVGKAQILLSADAAASGLCINGNDAVLQWTSQEDFLLCMLVLRIFCLVVCITRRPPNQEGHLDSALHGMANRVLSILSTASPSRPRRSWQIPRVTEYGEWRPKRGYFCGVLFATSISGRGESEGWMMMRW